MQCQYRSLVWVQLILSEWKDLATLEKKWSWLDTRQVDQGPTGLGVYWWQGHPSSSIVAREALVHTPESEEVRFYFMSCRIVEWCELDGEIVSAWPGNYFRLQRSPPTQPKRILAFSSLVTHRVVIIDIRIATLLRQKGFPLNYP